MKTLIRVGAFLVLASLFGCATQVNRENYERIETGMSAADVEKILGKPSETHGGGAGFSRFLVEKETRTWKSGDKTITVEFGNGTVAYKRQENLPSR
jgi:hypothetical protein